MLFKVGNDRDILEGKFDPSDLYKPHTEFGFVSSDAIDDEFLNSTPGLT
jgi:hypothetical protein